MLKIVEKFEVPTWNLTLFVFLQTNTTTVHQTFKLFIIVIVLCYSYSVSPGVCRSCRSLSVNATLRSSATSRARWRRPWWGQWRTGTTSYWTRCPLKTTARWESRTWPTSPTSWARTFGTAVSAPTASSPPSSTLTTDNSATEHTRGSSSSSVGTLWRKPATSKQLPTFPPSKVTVNSIIANLKL